MYFLYLSALKDIEMNNNFCMFVIQYCLVYSSRFKKNAGKETHLKDTTSCFYRTA